ncbi:uncharacterized protein LOC106472832, partial [Limulus polyphemus]|uniref:Uncharacterized protein LOC106472832 n=1 Tax=Limulus polyphemus TaxID=6850 RepID=A0ABM1BUJ9_LIMPO
QINWGECPQLEPTQEEKSKKQTVIANCLKENPPPKPEDEPSPEVLEKHHADITTCALKTEGWFDDNNKYKFDRAKTEIEQKALNPEITEKIKGKHEECKGEAEERFADDFISQVKLYQACMDQNISTICGIQIVAPPQA